MLKLCIYALLFVVDLQMSPFGRNFVIISVLCDTQHWNSKKQMITTDSRLITRQPCKMGRLDFFNKNKSAISVFEIITKLRCYCSLCFSQDANIHFATLRFSSFVWVCSCWQVDNYLKMLQLRSTLPYTVLESLNCLEIKSESDK